MGVTLGQYEEIQLLANRCLNTTAALSVVVVVFTAAAIHSSTSASNHAKLTFGSLLALLFIVFVFFVVRFAILQVRLWKNWLEVGKSNFWKKPSINLVSLFVVLGAWITAFLPIESGDVSVTLPSSKIRD
jgi:magnesium-transporting ATPase (P-type)